MRVLTVFSAIVLPLSLIAGIYGMNFEVMPELAKPWGYPFVLGGMVALAAGMLVWFRRKGWI
jgi:magnesium transporter